LNNGVTLARVKLSIVRTYFLDFHRPKVQVNMPFISNKYFNKEQINHNIYDEAGMNENMQY